MVDQYSSDNQWLSYRPSVGCYIDQYSTDMCTDKSANTRPICQLKRWSSVARYVDGDVDRYIGLGGAQNTHDPIYA